MAGRSASNAITRYAGIQVQTSSLGLNVPVGWGTFRCKCNLVDYLDFKSKADKAAAGKGGSTTTGYSYSATVILALCEGPIDGVSTVYVDGKVYTNAAKTALVQANLNLNTGAIGQSAWSYLTSNHPDHAIGYSGLAIVYQSNYALDSSATTPNHSFEVARLAGFGVSGSKDADPSLVVSDFFGNARYGVPSWAPGLLGDLTQYQDYCLAAGLLVSPVIDSQRSASDFLTELLRATNSTCVWSEGLLKFIPYGDTALSGNGKTYTPASTPVYSLNDDDYIPQSEGDDPLTVDIQDQSDAYNVVQLEYLDRTNQYNMAIALASDAANVAQYGMRRKDPDTVHCIAAPAVAALSAQLYLQRTLYIRSQFKFTVGWQFALLEPGDILELTDTGLGLNAYPVRIIQIDDDEDACRAIIAEDYPVGVANAPLYAMQNSAGYAVNQGIDPGSVETNLLLYSGDPTQSAWFKVNATVTGAASTDQFGLTTAAYIVPTAVSGVHAIGQEVANTFAGLNYTYSVCLQKSAHKIARVELEDGTNGVIIEVDLNAGTIVTPGTASGDAVLVSATMNPTLVSGIWRVAITAQFPGATALYGIVFANSDANANIWTGDGSNAILVSQQQLYQGLAGRPYAATTSAISGPYLFNPPSVLSSSLEVWAAVAGGPNWGGANVWASIDGTNYQQIGTIDGSARYGIATASFASHADPDTADTLSVDLGASAGALTGASSADADNGATLCLIDGELVCFSTATLTNPSRYNLTSYIRRGYLNSTIAAHAAGAPFVRLDEAIFDFPYFATNADQPVYIKFQSFNQWGHGVQSLSDCLVYTIVPIPLGAAAPSSAAWTAVGTTLSNAGQSIPAIVITGASDNPSATAIDFEYRVTGTTIWISAGMGNANATSKIIASVQSGQTYDVSVVYIVGDIVSNREIIASAITVGAIATGGAVGSNLINDSSAGSGKTVVLPGSGHVDIILTGIGGSGNGVMSGGLKDGFTTTNYGGGAGGTVVIHGFPASGQTLTYTLPSAVGSAATCTGTGLNITANSGTSATTSAEGAGGTATVTTATGASSTNAYTGHNGGLTDTWDGGGAANISGAYTDQTTDGTGGIAPGGGGAGALGAVQPGAGACLQIIARA
jgi:hypothetical protein